MIEDLRAFVSFVSHGSLSRTAAHLRLSQPAISRRIQRLEMAMGGTLLDRSVKPARLSALGVRLYERAQAVLQGIDGLQELMSEDGEPNGTLRIGAVQSISNTTAVSAVAQLKRRFPALRIEIQSDWSLELVRKIQLGRLDVAAVMLPLSAQVPEGVTGERIGTHRAAVVAPKSFPLKGSVALRQLAPRPWVLYPEGCILRAALSREFQARGLNLDIAVSDFGVEHQLGLVVAGAGLGFVSDIMVKASRYRDNLRVVRVKDFAFDFDIWLIHPPFLGRLKTPVAVFSGIVGERFGASKARSRQTRAARSVAGPRSGTGMG
ncbi:MAG TPA: LysR family transcriptional regulator [Burkholderiales bacterium]|nr:LysR family transcriptional regulator [Burkholderiales bacterium]